MASSGALRELVAYLGFDLDEKGLDKADKRIESTKKGAETLTRALETVGLALGVHEIGEFIEGQIQMGAALEHTSQQMGIGIEDLQKFQYAAATAGVGTEEADSALKFFNKNLGAARDGNAEAIKSFTELGFSMDDIKSNDLPANLERMADGFSKLNGAAERNEIASKTIGKSGGRLLTFLQKGGESVRGLYEEFDKLGGGLSEQFVEAAGEAEHQMVKLKYAEKGLSSELGAVLLPYVSELASGMANGLAQFRDWTKDTHLLRNALITLGIIAGILVITWGIMNIEILLVVAALALLALAVDDVITFFEGGDSVLGRFLDRMYGVGASKSIAEDLKHAWKEVADSFDKIWQAVKNLAGDLSSLFKTFKSGDPDNAKKGIQGIADAVKSLADWIVFCTNNLDKLVKGFDDFAKAHPLVVHAYERAGHQVTHSGLLGGSVFAQLPALAADVGEAFTGDASDVASWNKPGGQQADIPIYGPVNPNGGYGASGPVQQHNETHITLNGVGSPDNAATKVQAAVRDGQTDANNSAWYGTGGGGPP